MTATARRVPRLCIRFRLVGIAAAIPGAAEVDACDIDRFAIAAIRINAAANRSAWLPSKTDLVGRDEGWDALLAGEVC